MEQDDYLPGGEMEEYERECLRREADRLREEETAPQHFDVHPEDDAESIKARIKALEGMGWDAMAVGDVMNGYTPEGIIRFLKGRLSFLEDQSPRAMEFRKQRRAAEAMEQKRKDKNDRRKKDN